MKNTTGNFIDYPSILNKVIGALEDYNCIGYIFGRMFSSFKKYISRKLAFIDKDANTAKCKRDSLYYLLTSTALHNA